MLGPSLRMKKMRVPPGDERGACVTRGKTDLKLTFDSNVTSVI